MHVSKPRIVKIEEVRSLTPKVKLFTFRDKACSNAKPGQFIMVWVLGVDEIPMAVVKMKNNDLVGIAVEKVGDATSALHEKKVGDLIGIRGPYGNGFTLSKGNVILIGGGIGVAPLMSLYESLIKQGAKVTFVLGARTRDELVFLKELEDSSVKGEIELIIVTEDGSLGRRGLITDVVGELFEQQDLNMVYVCGKEVMIKKIIDEAEKAKIPVQASLTRYIRCGIGLCGSCSIGKYRVCKDGPVFSMEMLREVRDELGYFSKDRAGRKVKLF